MTVAKGTAFMRRVGGGAAGRRSGITRPALRSSSSSFLRIERQRGGAMTVSALASSRSVAAQIRLQSQCPFGRKFAVLGSSACLGSWDEDQRVDLEWTEGDVWVTSVTLHEGEELEYKYLLIGSSGEILEWLPGENKVVCVPADASIIEVEDSWTGAAPTLRVLQNGDGNELHPARVIENGVLVPEAVESIKTLKVEPGSSAVETLVSAAENQGFDDSSSSSSSSERAVPSSAGVEIEVSPLTFTEEELTVMTVSTLRQVAKQLSLSGYSRLKKSELITFLVANMPM